MLCRLCIYEVNEGDTVRLNINGEDSNLKKLIVNYMHIEVSKSDSFSEIICKECNQRLNEINDFFQYVKQRQCELQNEFSKVDCIMFHRVAKRASTHSEFNEMESLLDIEDIKIETQKSNESIADECDKLSNRNVEISDIIKPDPEKNAPNKNKIKSKNLKCKSNRCVNKLPTNHKKNISSKRITSKKIGEISKVIAEGSNEKPSNVSPPIEQLNKSVTLEENKLEKDVIAEYMKLKCEICQETAKEFADLKSHFRQIHNMKAFVTCCDKRFTRRFLLVDHIRLHLNPEHFKCKICSSVFKNRNTQSNHASKHADITKLKYFCSICPRRFAYLGHLTSHMESHNDKNSYLCKICKKGFKSNNLLKVHVRFKHDEFSKLICDVCGKEYKSKQAFDRHINEHRRQTDLPKEQCKICGKLFSIFYLPRHIKIHELININCEKCGKTCKSKSALAGHIEYAHKGRGNYSCTICNKTFLRREYLKEHINRHTGEKCYNCVYCTSEFRSKSNMYGHVKKAHFEEWTQAKLKRNQKSEISNDINTLKI